MTDWPYAEDGVARDEFAESLRIPVISNPYPRWNYITAVVVSDDLWIGLKPTDDEMRMIGSFNEEYCTYWYGLPHTGWRARHLDKRPFDIDGGANGVTFIKHEHGGWGYRRRSWSQGPTFVPDCRDGSASLSVVMDRIHTIVDHLSERWVDWKAARPDLYLEVGAS